MSAEQNLTEYDYELLSAYIDDMLTVEERSALEIRLENEPHLRRELAVLRQTVALINQLPPLKAPRDFTLDEAMFLRGTPQIRPIPMTRPPLRFPVSSMLSAAAAMVFMVMGVTLLLSGMRTTESTPLQPLVSIFTNVITDDDAATREIAAAPTELAAPIIPMATKEDGFAAMQAPDDAAEDEAFDAAPAPITGAVPGEDEATTRSRALETPTIPGPIGTPAPDPSQFAAPEGADAAAEIRPPGMQPSPARTSVGSAEDVLEERMLYDMIPDDGNGRGGGVPPGVMPPLPAAMPQTMQALPTLTLDTTAIARAVEAVEEAAAAEPDSGPEQMVLAAEAEDEPASQILPGVVLVAVGVALMVYAVVSFWLRRRHTP